MQTAVCTESCSLISDSAETSACQLMLELCFLAAVLTWAWCTRHDPGPPGLPAPGMASARWAAQGPPAALGLPAAKATGPDRHVRPHRRCRQGVQLRSCSADTMPISCSAIEALPQARCSRQSAAGLQNSPARCRAQQTLQMCDSLICLTENYVKGGQVVWTEE